VRARLVAKPEDYSHSSYQSYIFNREEGLVYRDLIPKMVSKRRRHAVEDHSINRR
jgi:hypothetical protein